MICFHLIYRRESINIIKKAYLVNEQNNRDGLGNYPIKKQIIIRSFRVQEVTLNYIFLPKI